MNFHTPHALQPFWHAAAAPIQAQALEQALAHRLFAHLVQPAAATQVAQALELDPTATAVWLDLLWSMDLLVRSLPGDGQATGVPHYVASALALRHFADGGAENCAQAWRYRAQFQARFATQWAQLLRTGSAAAGAAAAPQGSWAQAAREQIGQEQRAVTVPAVLRLLDSLPPLPGRGRLLDLGGGPGHVAIALAQRWPAWHGTVCDEPQTAEVARDNIRGAGLAQRLDALGCDLDQDGIGSGYDLVWCSSVLHFLRSPQAMVRRMAKALNPGSLLLLAHAELADDAALAAQVLPFYGPMLVRGNWLPRPGEIARMLVDAGCTRVQALGRSDFPMAPVWVHAGYRA